MSVSKSDDFQKEVSTLIIRNRNLLDILTKCQSSCSRICRSTIKTATGCGCLKIYAEKTRLFSEKSPFSSAERSDIAGTLCDDCKDIIENEIGEMLFYTAALCDALGLSMGEIMKKEIKNVTMLGKYSLR